MQHKIPRTIEIPQGRGKKKKVCSARAREKSIGEKNGGKEGQREREREQGGNRWKERGEITGASANNFIVGSGCGGMHTAS